MKFPTRPNFYRDLRIADPDETQLSREEVLHGLRVGEICNGPVSRTRTFTEVTVVERRLVEVINFGVLA